MGYWGRIICWHDNTNIYTTIASDDTGDDAVEERLVWYSQYQARDSIMTIAGNIYVELLRPCFK